MGYRIDYAVGGRTMRARVCGLTRRRAAAIGREIREEARRASIERLLIDVRGLVDRLGVLGTLVLAACGERRVAVVDSDDNARYHAFSEYAARRRHAQLRYFSDARAALDWLDD
jgi:hypothetical protein